MPKIANLGQVESATVTVLVDNQADLLAQETQTVKRFKKKPLLAEHGFAALIDLNPGGPGQKVLWDAGVTRDALLENMARMEIDPTSIDVIALSHGHGDHTAAVTDVLRAIVGRPESRKWPLGTPPADLRRYAEEGRRLPLVVHPAAFRERWSKQKDGAWFGPALPPPRAEWEAVGAEVILSEGPYQLAPGCWTTGMVPRRSFESGGATRSRMYRDGDQFLPDGIDDDQSILIHVRNKGLVIVSGCAHAGIVNTVNHAREISGVERVWAILGGFHLAPAKEDEIERTIDAIEALEPALVAPTHCTGFPAQGRFASRLPKAFVLNTVGATYHF